MKNRKHIGRLRLEVRDWKFEAGLVQLPTSNFQFPASAVILLFSLFTIQSLSAQQLQSYIQIAEKNSPEIQAFELRYDIASEKVNEVNTYSDTEFSAGYFISEPETRTGAQKARVSLRQMIPWFGTITARENYAGSLADAEYAEVAIAKRKLALAVAQSYYKLYANKAKQEVLVENIQLLDTYHELALNSLEVGNASAVDVLRLQIRQNDLEQQREILQQEFDGESALFNNLLNRDTNESIAIVDSLYIPEGQMEVTRIAEVHPELLKFDKLFESVDIAEDLNQQESLPKLGFGVDYISVVERPDMNFSDNGKDILMPMFSVSVPIFNNRYRSVTKQNELRQKEIQAQRLDRLLKLQTMLDVALNNRASSKITAKTQIENISQAKDAEEILIKNYETGTIDFNDVLDIQELQLKFQTGHIEAVKNYYIQSAIINYLSN